MSKMIQIRNVPDDVHRTLKIRAAEAGMTLSDYMLEHARRLAERPTLEEMIERLRNQPPLDLSEEPSAIIRRMRDSA
jgi:plasmid stability protein